MGNSVHVARRRGCFHALLKESDPRGMIYELSTP